MMATGAFVSFVSNTKGINLVYEHVYDLVDPHF